MSITSDQIRTVGFIHGLADDAADEIEELEKEVAALKAERDAAMKDAERYRWLTRTSDTNKFMVCDTDTQILYFGWEADEAIDAAIAKAEGSAA